MKIFVLTNQENNIDWIKSNLCLENIKEDQVIYDEEQLNEKLEEITQSDFTFVAADINWKYSSLKSDYNGFRIVNEEILPNNKSARIVFFHSFRAEDFTGSANNYKYDILQIPGHHYISTPAQKDLVTNLLEYPPLKPIDGYFIKKLRGDNFGKLSDRFHFLKNEVREKISKAEKEPYNQMHFDELKEFISNSIIGLQTIDEEQVKLNNQLSILIEKINNCTSYQEIETEILEATQEEFLKFFETDLLKLNHNELERRAWKILLLEDRSSSLKINIRDKHDKPKKVEFHKIFNVDEVIVVDTVQKAREAILIDEHLFNEIVIVIADLQLLNNKNVAQEEMGYNFIEWLNQRKYHLNKSFIFSQQNNEIVAGLISEFQLNSIDHSKNKLSKPISLLSFVKEIYAHGDYVWETLISGPTAVSWSPLNKAYLAHRNHPWYKYRELDLASEAWRICKQYRDTGKIEELKYAKSIFSDDGTWNKFANYMVARRVVAWLKIEMNLDRHEIYSTIKPNSYKKELVGIQFNEKIPNEIITLKGSSVTLSQYSSQLNHYFETEKDENKEIDLKNNVEYKKSELLEYAKILSVDLAVDKPKPARLKVSGRLETKEDIIFRKNDNNVKGCYSHLGLKLETLPRGLTLEERNWLKNYCGIKLHSDQSNYKNLISNIHKKLSLNINSILNIQKGLLQKEVTNIIDIKPIKNVKLKKVSLPIEEVIESLNTIRQKDSVYKEHINKLKEYVNSLGKSIEVTVPKINLESESIRLKQIDKSNYLIPFSQPVDIHFTADWMQSSFEKIDQLEVEDLKELVSSTGLILKSINNYAHQQFGELYTNRKKWERLRNQFAYKKLMAFYKIVNVKFKQVTSPWLLLKNNRRKNLGLAGFDEVEKLFTVIKDHLIEGNIDEEKLAHQLLKLFPHKLDSESHYKNYEYGVNSISKEAFNIIDSEKIYTETSALNALTSIVNALNNTKDDKTKGGYEEIKGEIAISEDEEFPVWGIEARDKVGIRISDIITNLLDKKLYIHSTGERLVTTKDIHPFKLDYNFKEDKKYLILILSKRSTLAQEIILDIKEFKKINSKQVLSTNNELNVYFHFTLIPYNASSSD